MDRLPGSAEEPEFVAVAVGTAAPLVAQIDPLDARLGERLQFLRVRDPVVAPVDPQQQGTERRIRGVQVAVPVAIENPGVEPGQCLIAVQGPSSVGEAGCGAEELAAIVDRAVPVAVQRQETVTPVCPRHEIRPTVSVDVEPYRIVETRQMDAVILKIHEDGRRVVLADVVDAVGLAVGVAVGVVIWSLAGGCPHGVCHGAIVAPNGSSTSSIASTHNVTDAGRIRSIGQPQKVSEFVSQRIGEGGTGSSVALIRPDGDGPRCNLPTGVTV